jgi:primary-amine oxidase
MPVEYAGFVLKPNGFFAANPAQDIAPERNGRSVLSTNGAAGTATSSCCHKS